MRVATPRDVASSTGQPRHVTTEIGVKLGAARGLRQSTSVGARHPCVAYRAQFRAGKSIGPTGRRTLGTNHPPARSRVLRTSRKRSFLHEFPQRSFEQSQRTTNKRSIDDAIRSSRLLKCI